MIGAIVSRCHVASSNRKVLRYVISRMKPGAWRGLSRELRREVMREVFGEHRLNREQYVGVMSGAWSGREGAPD